MKEVDLTTFRMVGMTQTFLAQLASRQSVFVAHET